MRSHRSKDKEIRDQAHLLKMVRETEAELPGVEPFLTALEGTNAKAVDSLSRRKAQAAASVEATRLLNMDLTASCDAAIALRHYIKGVLGFRTEKLRRYGIKPIRRRPKKRRTVVCGFQAA